jgi:uncharacterized membrane protein YfcA
MLVFFLTRQGISSDYIMHVALGTSMASILFTSASSFWAHYKRGGVHWSVVRRIVPGILVGAYLGSLIASRLSSGILKGIFGIFLYFMAAQLLSNKEPNPSRELPGKLGMFGAGNLIGLISGLVGVGGGALSVPFMMWCNLTVHNAIGTSTVIAFFIAAAGTLGYIYHGSGATILPGFSLGYVYVTAVAGVAASSIVTAHWGARLAYSLPVEKLRRIFALLLILLGTQMCASMVESTGGMTMDTGYIAILIVVSIAISAYFWLTKENDGNA